MNGIRKPTHIFFSMNGVLIDSARARQCQAEVLGHFMASRYGGEASAWTRAQHAIEADWDSYYADLDLGGDEAIAAMWEGTFRTTRALFRLTGTREPGHEALSVLSRTLNGQIARLCDTCYTDVPGAIRALAESGYVLGITTHKTHDHALGLLTGCSIMEYFHGPIIGPDDADQFVKDRHFLAIAIRKAQTTPENCVMVASNMESITEAEAAGMVTIRVIRDQGGMETATPPAIGSLAGLTEKIDPLAH